ncbi:hypothetical protein DPMN_154337 [Dreissena polymorpha]|uniref:Uncharacterized protein n=1 Tax=Dreissena polymorpha TaxID=45954 RepID=A0A9D4FLT1_DREPO|nr:hypothetical protein DPMN_154337 [Dreissena polymorpha]
MQSTESKEKTHAKMNTCTRLVIGVAFFLIGVFGQEIPDADKLRCRLCNNALELRECTKLAVCDNRTEECYMDQVVTETFNTVYRGGCRRREINKIEDEIHWNASKPDIPGTKRKFRFREDSG